MVQWMDHVDSILKNILHEVNTLEEFEKEKTVFQVFIEFFLFNNLIITYDKYLFLLYG